MHPRTLLTDTHTHMPAAHALDGLSSSDADRRIPPAPHSIAEIVAHMSFWQNWLRGRCDGSGEPMPRTAAEGWPVVEPGSWTDIREQFVTGLQLAASLDDRAQTGAAITPAIEFPLLAAYTIRDAIEHIAIHNAHHMGQIVLLRQLLGSWPPPAGSWTW